MQTSQAAPPPSVPPMPPPMIPPMGRPQYANVSPGLALILGFLIPGVGAIYNGQYAKGLVHAVVFGLLVSILSSGHEGMAPLFAFLLTAWVFYMGFEAYHTARRRRAGEPVDEFSSLLNLHGGRNQAPVAAVILIVLGVLLLLDTLDVLSFEFLVRYWPVLLIAAGVYLLYGRVAGRQSPTAGVSHERQ